MTIYLPDELAEQIKDLEGLNVSAICQDALRHELGRRQQLAALDKDMERVEAYVGDGKVRGAFIGKLIYFSDDQTVSAYLTRRHRIAVIDEPPEILRDFDTFEDLAVDEYWSQNAELLAAVAEALDVEHVIELDI
jgi:hypothetical protein